MEFINQVKQLRDNTKSPEVRQICESYLNGTPAVSKEVMTAMVNEGLSAAESAPTPVNYKEALRNEEMQTSKRLADSLMEKWGGLSTGGSSNAGSYLSNKKEDTKSQESLLESLASVSDKDETAKSFMEHQNFKNLGVMEAINTLRNSSIYEHPNVKVICENYSNLVLNKGIPEFSLIHNFINSIAPFKWDSSVEKVVENLKEKATKYEREIEVSKVLEAVKSSGSASFYSELSESLSSWLISENKSSGLLAKSISKWSFNPVVRNLVNYLNLNESKDTRKLEIPTKAQGESKVERIFSVTISEGDKHTFSIGKTIFEANSDSLTKLSQSALGKLPSQYLDLVSVVNDRSVKINENGIFVNFGKKIVRIIEENEEVSVYLDKSKLRFNTLGELAKMLSIDLGSYTGVNENRAINNVISLYRGYNNIVELDFAKSVVSNIYEGASVSLIKWNGKIYLQKVNEAMRENSLYQVNGSQAVNMVKSFLRYDISEGLTEFLEGEQKIKAVMYNDRTKVLENISRVEAEINKIEKLTESNALFANSKEIQSAHKILLNELNTLKEKWNQINQEIEKIESNPVLEDDLSEDEKFSVGAYVKIKESGETGKIISIDGTSGRYTVLMDNGKTSDFLVNEIVDLDQALSQAGEENADSVEASNDEENEEGTPDAQEEEGDEEVKEANDFNKSELSVKEQKGILNKLASNHGFSKAPKGDVENEEIEMEIDSAHGYNLTMNEGNGKTPLAKAPGDSKMEASKDKNPKKSLAVAPGNDKKVKGKVEGEELLGDDAPGKGAKVDFVAKDESGEKYDMGYNLKESEKDGMIEAPESGKAAKATPNTSAKNLTSKMDLAEAPGKEGDTDFEVNKEMGYNVTESEKDGMIEAPESGKAAKETPNASAKNLMSKMDLAEAPGKEGDIDFEVNKEMGYNVTESEKDGMVEAPETGKAAKETPNATAKSLTSKMELAEAPGKEGDIDFEVSKESGYNLSESEGEVKKK